MRTQRTVRRIENKMDTIETGRGGHFYRRGRGRSYQEFDMSILHAFGVTRKDTLRPVALIDF